MKHIWVYLLLLICNFAISQQKLIQVNKMNNAPEEVSIAINPTNPMQVAASSNISNYYYSVDGGKTWTEKQLKSEHGIWGDPMVYFDHEGILYYAHLGKNSEKYFPNWIDKIVVQQINFPYDTCFADVGIGFHENKIQDKEWLNSDLNGTVFMSWTEFDKYHSSHPSDHSRIRYSQSKDKGLSWSTPIIISDVEGDCLDGDSTMEGATSCADSKGNIYLCWSGINKIWFDKSTDGGITFRKDKIIANQVNGWDVPVKNIFRANGMPFILCNNINANFKDRIYVNWTDTRNGDADVFLKYSDDGGETWSDDKRVNNDVLGNGADQFSNNFCVDASTGFVYVIFYDQRNSRSGAYLDVYVACSKDGGDHWSNLRITPQPFAAPGKSVFFGDYIDIDAVQGKVMPIFTIHDKNNFKVYTTSLDTLPSAETTVYEEMQAVILEDTLFIHLRFSPNKNFILSIAHNGRKTTFEQQGKGEQEFAIYARGFKEAKITLKYGFKRKCLKVHK